MKLFIFSLSIISICFSFAQTQSTLTLRFSPTWSDSLLVLNAQYRSGDGEFIQIETFKFYISGIELLEEGKTVFAEKNSYHLINAEDPESLSIQLDVAEQISWSHIRFNLGIDSLTSVSGAFGGDLDPTRGMYWTWQSGYIFVKLEGISPNCSARHNRFQYHIGGYQAPFKALQPIELQISPNSHISIEVALDKLFRQINLAETYQIMSPSQESLSFSQLIPSLFSITK